MPTTLRFLTFIIFTAVSASSFAQGDRRPGPPDGRTMSPDEIKARISRTENLLASIDANRNGIIEAEEAQAQREIIDRILSRAGLQPTFPIPIGQIRDRLAVFYQAFGDSRLVPSAYAVGGYEPQAGAPPGQGVLPQPRRWGGPDQSNDQRIEVTPEATARIRDLAAAIIYKYDRHRRGKLTRDEWPKGRWGTFDEANRQGGNYVTMEELILHLTDLYNQQTFYFSSSGVHFGRRFLTAEKHRPDGLPDWFLTKDVNRDGQVTMHEYSNNWTFKEVAEFNRYDLNRDGVITAEECLKVERAQQWENEMKTRHPHWRGLGPRPDQLP